MKRTPDAITRDAAIVYDAISDVLDRINSAGDGGDSIATQVIETYDLFKLATLAAGAAAESLRRSLIESNIHTRRAAMARIKNPIGYYYNKRDGLVRIKPDVRPESEPKVTEGGDS